MILSCLGLVLCGSGYCTRHEDAKKFRRDNGYCVGLVSVAVGTAIDTKVRIESETTAEAVDTCGGGSGNCTRHEDEKKSKTTALMR